MMSLPYFKENSVCSENEQDFQEDMFRSKVNKLWQEQCLIDVSLACENKVLTAHKLVLGAYSDYFKEMFTSMKNTSQYPIVFMKDISYDMLKAVLEFMYQGEVNVPQDSLHLFMKTAQSLRVKGINIPDEFIEVLNGQSEKKRGPKFENQEATSPSPPSKRLKGKWNNSHSDYEEMNSPTHSEPELDSAHHSVDSHYLNDVDVVHHMPSSETLLDSRRFTYKTSESRKFTIKNDDSTQSFQVKMPQIAAERKCESIGKNRSLVLDSSVSEFKERLGKENENVVKTKRRPYRFIKRKCHKREDILAAIRAMHKGMPLVQASEKYNIPIPTLSRKYTTWKKENGFMPDDHSVHLENEYELKLMELVLYMNEITPLTSNQVKMLAMAIDSVIGTNKFEGNVPKKIWWADFKKRHPDIAKLLRQYDFINDLQNKLNMLSFKALADYLVPVQEIIDAFELHDKPENFWSCSEYSLNLANDSRQILTPARARFIKSKQFTFEGPESASIMFAGSAAGNKVPPFVILQDSVLTDGATKEGPAGAFYEKNATGFMDSDLLFTWFKHVFLPHCPKNRSIDNPVILLLNSSFPLAPQVMLDMAHSENIILLSLMPHLHHACQPMDSPVVKGFGELLEDTLRHELEAKDLQHLPKLIKEPFEVGMTSDMVIEGFRICGIFPLTVNVDQNKYLELRSLLKFDSIPSFLENSTEDSNKKMPESQNREISILKEINKYPSSDEGDFLEEDSISCSE